MFLEKISTEENEKFPMVFIHTVDTDHPTYWSDIKEKEWPDLKDLRMDEINQIAYEANDGIIF